MYEYSETFSDKVEAERGETMDRQMDVDKHSEREREREREERAGTEENLFQKAPSHICYSFVLSLGRKYQEAFWLRRKMKRLEE